MCDQGKEFLGEDFSDFCGNNGSLVHVVDAKSPWQNGRTERAGGAFKEKLATVIADEAIVSHEDFQIALACVCAARNRLCDKSGFSPDQWIFQMITPEVDV